MQFTSLSYVYIPSGTWEAKASSQLCRWKKCYWNVEISRVSDNLLSVLMSVCTVCKCVSTNMDTGSCVEATGQLSLSLIHNKPSPQHHGLNVSSDYCGKVCWNLKNYHYKTRHWSANPWPNNLVEINVQWLRYVRALYCKAQAMAKQIKHHMVKSNIMRLEYAHALTKASKMADSCASNFDASSVTAKRLFYNKHHILNESVAVLRWSVGFLGQFVAVWKRKLLATQLNACCVTL